MAGDLESGYVLLGFAEEDEETGAPGEWTIGRVERYSFDDLSTDGVPLLLIDLARRAIESKTFGSNANQTNYQVLGSLYGFDADEEREMRTEESVEGGR